jgi:hypothetical protein
MKIVIHVFLFFCTFSIFSQVKFEKIPENVKEIHFTYEMKSNYVINEEGVFADTLLLKIDFPDVKYTLRKHPKDTMVFCGFSTIKNFGETNKSKLLSIIYHTNETINAIHFIHKGKTVFKVVRGDEETKKIFKEYFKESFTNFKYTEYFDFVKKKHKVSYPRVSYDQTFAQKSKIIEHHNDESFGNYHETYDGFDYQNVVFFNNDLSKYISPVLFSNIKFGVEKLETIKKTITLQSVYYK